MNIPAVIIEMDEYVKKFSEQGTLSPEAVQEAESISAKLDTSVLTNPSDIRERVKEVFLWANEQFGYDEFRRLAIRLKTIEGLSQQDSSAAKGVVAEMFAFVTVSEYVRLKTDGSWKVYHSLKIPFASGGKGSTELDLVVATPSTVVVFEVKSFNGKKTLSDICTITTPWYTRDLFKQNGLHCRCLWEHLQSHALSDIGALTSVFFGFAVGEVKDTRTNDNKRRMPHLHEDNLVHFLNALNQTNRTTWKSSMFSKLQSLSESGITDDEHLSYVQSLRHK